MYGKYYTVPDENDKQSGVVYGADEYILQLADNLAQTSDLPISHFNKITSKHVKSYFARNIGLPVQETKISDFLTDMWLLSKKN